MLSRQWYRCAETANLLGLGPVEELLILNSDFQRYGHRIQQMQALENGLPAGVSTERSCWSPIRSISRLHLTSIQPRVSW